MRRFCLIGHRGLAASAPENTLAGFRAAAAAGLAWVEFDVRLSGDGVPVVIHDATLKRTTGQPEAVGQTPWPRLARLDAGGWFGLGFAGEPIPSLAAVLDFLAAAAICCNIEMKADPGREAALAAATAAVLRAHWPGAAPRPLISSFNERALRALPRAGARWTLGVLAERPGLGIARRLRRLGAGVLACDARWLGARKVEALRSLRRPLLAYTVNRDLCARRLIHLGVSGIFSDCADRLSGARQQWRFAKECL